jgi:hypothetical protein
MKKYFLIIFFLITLSDVKADGPFMPAEYYHQLNLGLGFGIDYGGIGARLNYVPERHFVVFVGAGYNFVKAGYNVGASYRFNPTNRWCFYYTLMYGYNAAVKVENASHYDKVYYGPSTGAGLELRLNKDKGNYFNFELLVPIRSQEYEDDFEDIKNNPNIQIYAEPLPVTISVGYHFSID